MYLEDEHTQAVDEEPKKEQPREIVDTKGHDLWMLFAVGIFLLGAFSFYVVQNSLGLPVSDLNVTNDFNVTEEHLALASNQQAILNSLIALQVQHLCGSNLLIPDSNRIIQNQQGTFVTYSCYSEVK